MSNKLDIEEMPGKYGKRVFIGGNYDFPANLREIKKFVEELNFQPILALDFDVPEGNIHNFDLRLLHNCKYAIFDVTHSAGELMELERCKDYGTQVMVVYQAKEREKIPAQLSTMILTAGFRRRGYLDFPGLKGIVKEFLLEEDGLFLTYLKVFGYKIGTLETSIKINKDRSSSQIVKYSKLEVVDEKIAITQEGPHFFEVVTGGKITKGPIFTTDREDIVKWQKDEKKRRSTYREGIVVLENLKKETGPVNYGFETGYEGGVCLTKEGFDEISSTIPEFTEFPYEFYDIIVKAPIETLKLGVSFFNGYKVNVQPIAFFGRQREEDAVTGSSASFIKEENRAILTIKRPRIFYNYRLFWEPMLKEEYDKL